VRRLLAALSSACGERLEELRWLPESASGLGDDAVPLLAGLPGLRRLVRGGRGVRMCLALRAVGACAVQVEGVRARL
jgi:hypothetical protein